MKICKFTTTDEKILNQKYIPNLLSSSSVSLPVSSLDELTIVNANKVMKMDPMLLLRNPALRNPALTSFFFDIVEL